jgi:hypothetical protein
MEDDVCCVGGAGSYGQGERYPTDAEAGPRYVD